MARSRSAWCPGGRTPQNARSASPLITRSTAFTTAPAARRAARSECGFIAVSPSTQLIPSVGLLLRQFAQIVRVVRGLELRILDQRCVVMAQGHIQSRGYQPVIDSRESCRLFRVVMTHVMRDAIRV
jgi:hypothetical protein